MPTKAKKSTAKAVPVQQPDPEVISIRVLEERELTIPIEGVTPLIMNEFGHKSKEQMLESMQGKKVNTKERPPKDPLEDYKHNPYNLILLFSQLIHQRWYLNFLLTLLISHVQYFCLQVGR